MHERVAAVVAVLQEPLIAVGRRPVARPGMTADPLLALPRARFELLLRVAVRVGVHADVDRTVAVIGPVQAGDRLPVRDACAGEPVGLGVPCLGCRSSSDLRRDDGGLAEYV